MKNLTRNLTLAAGLAALVGWASPAAAQSCAYVCEQTDTVSCAADGSRQTASSHVVIGCENFQDDPTALVPGGPETCGQVCVDGVLLIGGWAGLAVPAGCIHAVAAGTDTLLGDDCTQSAVAACEANGCATSTPGDGPCAGTGYPQRGGTNVVDETGGAC